MTAPIPSPMSGLVWCLLLSLSLLWGGSFFFGEVALAELPPLTTAWARVATGALGLWLLLLLAEQRMPRGGAIWRRYFAMGLINNALPFALILWGQKSIGAPLAAILNATTPFFGVLLADRLTHDERLTPARLLGVVLGVAGVAVMLGLKALGGLPTALLPSLAVLAAACSYAFAGIYGRGFRDHPPLVTATGQVTASTLLLLPAALALEQPWLLPWPSTTALAAVAGLGLLSTALAYWLYFSILTRAGATNLLLVTLLIPPSAIALSVLFLERRLDWQEVAGFALIALGLAALDSRLGRVLRPFRRPA